MLSSDRTMRLIQHGEGRSLRLSGVELQHFVRRAGCAVKCTAAHTAPPPCVFAPTAALQTQPRHPGSLHGWHGVAPVAACPRQMRHTNEPASEWRANKQSLPSVAGRAVAE